jgi:hypothetical protein
VNWEQHKLQLATDVRCEEVFPLTFLVIISMCTSNNFNLGDITSQEVGCEDKPKERGIML